MNQQAKRLRHIIHQWPRRERRGLQHFRL